MTIENLKDRNIKILNNLIRHYKIKFTADELINNFRTVYLHKIDSEISEILINKELDKSISCQVGLFTAIIFNRIATSCGRIPLCFLILQKYKLFRISQIAK